MKIVTVTYQCDGCGFSTPKEGELKAYVIKWEGRINKAPVTIERHYCWKCDDRIQASLVVGSMRVRPAPGEHSEPPVPHPQDAGSDPRSVTAGMTPPAPRPMHPAVDDLGDDELDKP